MFHRNNVLPHSRARQLEVCAPQGTPTHKVLAVELADELIAEIGEMAVVLLGRPPTDGEPGAIRSDGETFVGHIHYRTGGGVIVCGSNPDDGLRFFAAGSYELLGMVYRICACAVGGECRSVSASPDCSDIPTFAVK
jgi:hypothetical protein